jgi:hypothetical protein
MAGSKHDVEWWNPFSWWGALGDDAASAAKNWLGGLAGDIGSGIEAGYVSIFEDTWHVILPWIELAIGCLIAMWAIGIWLASSRTGEGLISSVAYGTARGI